MRRKASIPRRLPPPLAASARRLLSDLPGAFGSSFRCRPAKPADESKLMPESMDDDDDALARIDDKVASREDVKKEAQKSLRVEQRRLARATQGKDGMQK